MHNLKIFLRFAVIIIFAFLAYRILGTNNDGDNTASFDSDADGTFVNTTTPKAAPLPVSAARLFNDYAANEEAADKMYKGKLLEVTGTVESINVDIRGNIYIVMPVGDFNIVQCSFSKNYKSQAANLVKGQTVTVIGEGSTTIAGSPVVRKCAVKGK